MWVKVVLLLLGCVGGLFAIVLGIRAWRFYKQYRRVKKYKEELLGTLRGTKDLDDCDVFGSLDIDESIGDMDE